MTAANRTVQIASVAAVVLVAAALEVRPVAVHGRGGTAAVRDAAVLPGLTAADTGNDAAKTVGGIVVTSVQSNSAAARAGIVAGDHILAFDGRRMATLGAARAYVRGAGPTIDMQVYHHHAKGDARRDEVLEVRLDRAGG